MTMDWSLKLKLTRRLSMQEQSKNKKQAVQYCGNCFFCKRFKEHCEDLTSYVFKIRCSKKQWKYKSGAEKVYDYHTLLNRKGTNCQYYESTSEIDEETKQFIKHLRKTLPAKRIVYSSSNA